VAGSQRGAVAGLGCRAAGIAPTLYLVAVAAAALTACGLVGLAASEPWLFPSLGPTVMVLVERPRAAAAAPRNVLLGHLAGIAVGWLCLALTGLLHAPPAITAGLSGVRIVAAVLSVALTILVLLALRAPHAPAVATTLIVSLGILRTGPQLLTIVLAVLLVLAVVWLLDLAVRTRRPAPGGGDRWSRCGGPPGPFRDRGGGHRLARASRRT